MSWPGAALLARRKPGGRPERKQRQAQVWQALRARTAAHLKRLLEAAEREILQAELGRADWNVSQAARNLGIDRANLHRKMRRLGISRE